MSSAERVAVPLKSMCSTKWAIPPRSAVSCREPRVSQTPMLIERTCVIRSVKIRSPLPSTSLTMGELDKDEARKAYATIAGWRVPRMTAVEPRPDLADLERPALESALDARGHKRFHARQIFRWIYKHGVTDIAAMTDLSRELRATLAQEFTITTPTIVARE